MNADLVQLRAALPASGVERATRLGLALAPRLEPDAWRHLVARVANLAHTTSGARHTLTAWLGDALAYNGKNGRGLIAECAAAAGLDPGTLRNAKMVCARIPVSCRHEALSWTHHCEVGLAFAEPKEIEHWLALAETERWSAAELRRRVRAHRAVAFGGTRATSAPAGGSVAPFRLLRELRAVGRSVARERELWRAWTPTAAKQALEELRGLAEFLDALRVRARSGRPHR